MNEPRIEIETQRPATRADCVDGLRPCPWPSCAHHLAGVHAAVLHGQDVPWTTDDDVLDVADMAHTCALDVADEDGATLEAVGDALGLTRERIRQIEAKLLVKLRQQASFLLVHLSDATSDDLAQHGATDDIIRDLNGKGVLADAIAQHLRSIGRVDWTGAKVRTHFRALGIPPSEIASAPPPKVQRRKNLLKADEREAQIAERLQALEPGRWIGTAELNATVHAARATILRDMRRLRQAGKVEAYRSVRNGGSLRWRWAR